MSEPDFIAYEKGHLFSMEERAARREWAVKFVLEFEKVAAKLGYGIATLGSFIRDIDLIAVPWSLPAGRFCTHLDFVLALMDHFDLQLGNHGETIAGHRRYVLWHKAHRDHYIDLKVILPVNKMEVA